MHWSEGVKSLGIGVTDGCELLWELYLGSLEEQPVLSDLLSHLCSPWILKLLTSREELES